MSDIFVCGVYVCMVLTVCRPEVDVDVSHYVLPYFLRKSIH